MPDATLTAALALRLYVATRSYGVTTLHRFRTEERGEGVISAAIAVLVMAFLGVLMWGAFKGIFNSAADKAKGQVDGMNGG